MPRDRIADSYANFIFSFWRNNWNAFRSSQAIFLLLLLFFFTLKIPPFLECLCVDFGQQTTHIWFESEEMASFLLEKVLILSWGRISEFSPGTTKQQA